MIRKPVAYHSSQHIEAEAVLRRGRLIALHVLRMGILIGILFAWLSANDWVRAQEFKRAHMPLPAPTLHEEALRFLPYAIWIPLGIWVWLRLRLARRKAWLQAAQAGGIHHVEWSAEGFTSESDAARCFYRWDCVGRMVDRKNIFVLFFNRASAILIPKMDCTPEETRQILQWQRTYIAAAAPLRAPPAQAGVPSPSSAGHFSCVLQADRKDYRECLHMIRWKGMILSLLIRRWVRICMLILIAIGFAALTGYELWKFRGPRDLLWYWMTFGLPAFLAVIYVSSWAFTALLRWIAWRDVRPRVTMPRTLVTGDEGVEIRTIDCVLAYRWPAFNSIEVGKRIIMLGLVGGAHVIIPRRQIPMGDLGFVDYLRRHIVTITQGFPVQMPVQTVPQPAPTTIPR